MTRLVVLVVVMVFCYSLVNGHTSIAHQCFKRGVLQNMTIGQRLETDPFAVDIVDGPLHCARRCKRHSMCRSVNINTKSVKCELNTVAEGNFISKLDSAFIDIRTWTQAILESCQNHQCPNNTYCQEKGSAYTCVPIGCTGVPHIAHVNATSFMVKDLWNFNESVTYVCDAGYFPSENAVCTDGGSWNIFACYKFGRCQHIQTCDLDAPDGDYLLYVKKIDLWIKLYCRMAPLHAYVTLHENNFASTPEYFKDNGTCGTIESTDPIVNTMGYTKFHKVGFGMAAANLKIDKFDYVTTTNMKQRLGTAGDCYAENSTSECGVIGQFIINLQGTGVRVRSDIQWQTWGESGVIGNITRSTDGVVIQGFCGGGCGGCEPSSLVYVEPDPYFPPPMNLAYACERVV